MAKQRIKHRRITNNLGAWSWDAEKLNNRIVKTSTDECWLWLGTQNKHGNLFGAYKNGQARMTQANRIIYMEHAGVDIELQSVTMKCKNRYCCNPSHFVLKPNKRIIQL